MKTMTLTKEQTEIYDGGGPDFIEMMPAILSEASALAEEICEPVEIVTADGIVIESVKPLFIQGYAIAWNKGGDMEFLDDGDEATMFTDSAAIFPTRQRAQEYAESHGYLNQVGRADCFIVALDDAGDVTILA